MNSFKPSIYSQIYSINLIFTSSHGVRMHAWCVRINSTSLVRFLIDVPVSFAHFERWEARSGTWSLWYPRLTRRSTVWSTLLPHILTSFCPFHSETYEEWTTWMPFVRLNSIFVLTIAVADLRSTIWIREKDHLPSTDPTALLVHWRALVREKSQVPESDVLQNRIKWWILLLLRIFFLTLRSWWILLVSWQNHDKIFNKSPGHNITWMRRSAKWM